MLHYCGYSVPFTKECPGCHEPEVRYTGSGTQKAEEELCTLFPKARILRLVWHDSTMRRHAYETKMKAFSNGEYDIIIGTQMVAKGLDFENVTRGVGCFLLTKFCTAMISAAMNAVSIC